MAKKDFLFFWGGTFSQWCPSPIVIDGVNYNCTEQYMMAKKALMFSDYDAYREIMLEKQPALQKAMGKKVRGFDKVIWETYCRKIVYDANYAKFTQNKGMRDELMASGQIEIVEASPEDRIWGIGLHERDERAWDKSTWEGTNWLGEAIMSVRSTLQAEEGIIFSD
jgi:ribA/ribD-fused uncharacterized protein